MTVRKRGIAWTALVAAAALAGPQASYAAVPTAQIENTSSNHQGIVLRIAEAPELPGTSYTIYRSPDGKKYKVAGEISAAQVKEGKLTFCDTDVKDGDVFHYKAVARVGITEAPESIPVVAYKPYDSMDVKAKSSYTTIKLSWDKKVAKGVDRIKIERSEHEKFGFKTIATVRRNTCDHTDKNRKLGTRYYYRVSGYDVEDGKRLKMTEAETVKVVPQLDAPENVTCECEGLTVMNVSWDPVDKADGYVVYASDPNESKLKKYQTLKGKDSTAVRFGDIEDGQVYRVKVVAYRNINKGDGKKGSSRKQEIGSKARDNKAEDQAKRQEKPAVKSKHHKAKQVNVKALGKATTVSHRASFPFYGDESYATKYRNVFGTGGKYKSAEEARKHMMTIAIDVWDFANGQSGEKVTRTLSVTVNKAIAPVLQKIFKAIYEGEEKAPIYSIGCYSWRSVSGSRGTVSQHAYGLALDINADYNPMYDNGKISVGSHEWDPERYAYSIPRNGDIEKAFARYGFGRGLWGSRMDYMHFSYLGT